MSSTGEDASVSKKMRIESKPLCPYGNKCYRKNPIHFKEYDHPAAKAATSDSSSDESASQVAPVQIDTSKLPPCPFGSKCYRKNLLHFAEYSHPVADDGASTSKLVPDDCSNDSDTDVYDSDVEEEKQQVLLHVLYKAITVLVAVRLRCRKLQ